eukprot:7384265-Prymnesium_polylepis.2
MAPTGGQRVVADGGWGDGDHVGSGLRVEGLGLRASGSGFTADGLGLRASGFSPGSGLRARLSLGPR